jgi:hypothetical protein
MKPVGVRTLTLCLSFLMAAFQALAGPPRDGVLVALNCADGTSGPECRHAAPGTQAGNPCAPQELGNTTPGAPSGAGPRAPECGASPAAANDPSRAATDPATSPATGTTTGAAGSSPGTERAATGASAAQTAGGRRSQSTGCPAAPGPAGFALGGADPASASGAGGRSDDRASVSAPTPRQSAGRPERACSSLARRGQRCAKGPSGSARVSGGFRNEPATRRRSPAARAGRLPRAIFRTAVRRNKPVSQAGPDRPLADRYRWRRRSRLR